MQTSPAELTLIDGTTAIVVRPMSANAGNPVYCKQWDLGAPEARYTSTNNANADGVTITDGYTGSRTVTLSLQVVGDPGRPGGHDPYWYVDKLTAMCHPARNPVLTIKRAAGATAGQTWRMPLKGNPWSVPFTRRSAAIVDLELSFLCPTGMLEGPLRGPFTTSTASGVPATDWKFPAKFPKTFGNGSWNVPSAAVVVGGNAPVSPIVYISGPVKNPEVRDEAGNRFRFDGLTLIAGQTVEIHMGLGTVRLGDSSTGAISDDPSTYQYIDWEVSSFWLWQPGSHTLQYRASGGVAALQFREYRSSV